MKTHCLPPLPLATMVRWRLPRMLVGSLCLVALSAGAAERGDGSERYEGLAHARQDGRLLYREIHWRYQDKQSWQHLVLYSCPNGVPFARKLLREVPSAEVPDFDFQDARDGYREGVRSQGAQREVYVQSGEKAPLETQTLTMPPGAVIDAGFDAFVRGHWSALSGGASVKVPFLIPSRKDYLDFKIADARDAVVDGRSVRRLRMKLNAWYGFALPNIDLAYERDGSRLVEFQGPGTIRDRQGRPLDVRIIFPLQQRMDSPLAADIAQAATRPLTSKPCIEDAPR